jgi:ribosomal protein S18 acetylase RimI-like enzyme
VPTQPPHPGSGDPGETARRADIADLDDLARLAQMGVGELTPMRGGELWALTLGRSEPLTPTLQSELTDPNRLVVVGCLDDAVVGYGTVRLQGLADGTIIGVVDDIFTEPDARGVGVGEAMMDLLVAWCRERRCAGIDAVALPGNRATKNFFERFGLTARAILVHRRLADAAEPTAGDPAGPGGREP